MAATILIILLTFFTLNGKNQANLTAPTLKPDSLQCEYRINPLGIDVPWPRLSWVLKSDEASARGLRQTGYQIQVASSQALLQAAKADLWDSGKVESARQNQVEYAGKALASRARCWWKVRVWDQSGRVSPWSASALWSMGLLHPSDWAGQWISGSIAVNYAQALYLRRVIPLRQAPTRATAYICGLGYYRFYIDRHRVGQRVLDPAFTNYDKRVLYATYDVTHMLREGHNALGVVLGNGWYHPITPDLFGFQNAPWRETPRLLINLDVEFPDGGHETIASDPSWKWTTGPIVFNGIRGGITYDARRAMPGWDEPRFDDSNWQQAEVVPAPKGKVEAQMEPPMRETEIVHPVRLTEPKPDVYVFDLGVNLTGWARFVAHGKPGQKIVLKYDLELNPDGTVNMEYCHSHTYGRFQTDELILNQQGKGALDPQFTYHGFRYVEIDGLDYKPALASLVGVNVHTDWRSAGSFSSSDPAINRMQEAVRRTLSESAHSLPGEEPTREKMGWTQDGQNSMDAAVYNFHAAAVYTNYVFDMINAQQRNGSVPPIVPTNGWGLTGLHDSPAAFSDPWWGGTLPYVAWHLYDDYGDRRVLVEAYEPMKRWADYLTMTSKDHLLDWGLGDWLEVGAEGRPKRTPVVQTSTAGYYYCVMAVARAARLLGKPRDAEKYGRLGEKIRTSFNQQFFNRTTGLYAEHSQTSQVLPLYLGMVPKGERPLVLRRLMESIHRHHDHMTTGFVGVMPMLFGLADWGHPRLAYTVAMQKDRPGFLWMVANGNTTMRESVDGPLGTLLHPFGTCIGGFLFRDVAGIRPDPSAPGYNKIIIRPVPGNLRWVRARYDSIAGAISVNWQHDAAKFTLQVSIPPNTTATVYLPASLEQDVMESGRPLAHNPGIKLVQPEKNTVKVEIGSGKYEFLVTGSNL
ncbi:MAG: family 78 glycoside hydrolase catalytic domain [Terriglobia bacterium]